MQSLRTTFQLLTRSFGLLSENCCESCCGQDLSMVQSHILYEIKRQHHPSMQDAANALGADITTFSRQVKTLVEKGYVKKTPDPNDNRINILSLTAAGEEAETAMESTMNENLEQIMSRFSDFERQSIINSLNLLNRAMQESELCCITSRSTGRNASSCCTPPK